MKNRLPHFCRNFFLSFFKKKEKIIFYWRSWSSLVRETSKFDYFIEFYLFPQSTIEGVEAFLVRKTTKFSYFCWYLEQLKEKKLSIILSIILVFQKKTGSYWVREGLRCARIIRWYVARTVNSAASKANRVLGLLKTTFCMDRRNRPNRLPDVHQASF